MDLIIFFRNQFIGFFYRQLLKRLFFQFDPEHIHDGMTHFGQVLGSTLPSRKITGMLFNYSHPSLEQNILGIRFQNPIGLSAGFDKDALLTDIIPYVGFGFEEVGSITGEKCEGNPKPRLWRLKKSKSLIVYYGLKNDGSEAIARRLSEKEFYFPIGTSIAKTNREETVEIKAGIADYVKAYKQFVNIGSYSTINISCPNAYGGQPFTDKDRLDKLLNKIDKIPTKKPIFLKLSPDLSQKELDDILIVVKKHRIDGFICSNLTKDRKTEKIKEKLLTDFGGFSGKVVEEKANQQIAYVYKQTKGKYVIIGCGGVFSAHDAYQKIKLGASLIQMITGIIFEGPQVISEINRGLVKLLRKDGYTNISQAVGTANRS